MLFLQCSQSYGIPFEHEAAVRTDIFAKPAIPCNVQQRCLDGDLDAVHSPNWQR